MAENEPSATPPEDEPAGKPAPEPAPSPSPQPSDASELPSIDPDDPAHGLVPETGGGSHDRRLLGIKLHNLIFVGMFLGLLIGLAVFALDHFDHLKLVDGTEVVGSVQVSPGEYVVTHPNGEESRYPASQVATNGLTRAEETSSGRLYLNLIWWLNFFGKTLFMSALKMIIAPLIMASIVAGIVSLKGLDQLKRIGVKTMAYYVCTTAIAVAIGLIAVSVIRPGKQDPSLRTRREAELRAYEREYTADTHLSPRTDAGKVTHEFLAWLTEREAERAGTGGESSRFAKLASARGTSPGDQLKNNLIRPMLTNPFTSLTEGKSLGIITFALLLGVAIVVVGRAAKPVAEVFIGFNDVMVRITEWLMTFAPFCVMCIIAELVGTQGPEVFATLAWYVATVIVGIGLHVAFLVAVAKFLGGKGPLELWNGIREAWMIAFTTRSSAATLPVTMRCVTTQLGVSPRVANFALPVGATMNMDGTALYEGVAVIFLLQIYAGLADVPIEMTVMTTFLIFITAVLASVGAAAVPDAGLVTMVLVAEAVHLPIYYIPLIFAVDAFLDMFRTSTNVLGDAVGCLVVQRLEGLEPQPV